MVPLTDPVERVVAEALTAARIEWRRGGHKELDFFLPTLSVWIECKRFHSDRISEQMSRYPNVIAIQGLEAAQIFAAMITAKLTTVEG